MCQLFSPLCCELEGATRQQICDQHSLPLKGNQAHVQTMVVARPSSGITRTSIPSRTANACQRQDGWAKSDSLIIKVALLFGSCWKIGVRFVGPLGAKTGC